VAVLVDSLGIRQPVVVVVVAAAVRGQCHRW